MLHGPVDPNKYLYHYTSRETAIEYILRDLRLRLSPFTGTNDPRESKFWNFTYSDYDYEDAMETYRLHSDMNEGIKRQCYIACLTCDDQAMLRKFAFNPIGRGYSRPRMWAQYAGNHSGVCLILDKEALIEAAREELGHFGRIYRGRVKYNDFSRGAFTVSYVDIEEHGVEKVAETHIKKNYKPLFLVKSTDWKAEQEYRIILISPDDSPKYVSIEKALRGIVVGVDFPDVYMVCLEAVHREYGVRIAQMQWLNGSPVCVELQR